MEGELRGERLVSAVTGAGGPKCLIWYISPLLPDLYMHIIATGTCLSMYFSVYLYLQVLHVSQGTIA